MAAIHIVKFIQSLNEKEIQVIDDYIQSIFLLSGSTTGEESKQLKLFRFITTNKDRQLQDTELAKHISTNNLSSLKYLLSEKIYDALLLSKHIENDAIFNHREQMVFSLKKKIILIKSLYRVLNQGRTETINFLLSETIKLAKENEIYDVLIESLILQKYHKAMRLGMSEFENINNQITFYEYCFKAVQNANDAYYRLILNREFIKSLTEKELEKHLKLSINQMELDYKKTKSQEVNYYTHILQIALFENEKKFKQAIIHLKKILSLVKGSTILYSKDRVGFAMNNLSWFSVLIENYKEAALHAKNAQKFLIPNSMSYLIVKEQEFYAYWYSGNFKDAVKCTEEMLEHSMADTGGYRKSKFIYYEACVLFVTKQFKEALQLLNKSLEIEKDKTGWNIALRTLNILVFIELNKINEASRSLEALRKYMERLTKSDEVKQRDILIIKLLREIEKDGFRYDPKNANATKMLKELSEKDKPVSWNYYTPELIPFHEWVKGTAGKK
jgi:tetratricopeptide (TPR) repeat protein